MFALGLGAAGVIGLQSRAQAGDNMRDQLIVYFCSRAIRADFRKAGKTAPEQLVQDSCNCVVQQINRRATIDQAKAICRADAQKRFPTPDSP